MLVDQLDQQTEELDAAIFKQMLTVATMNLKNKEDEINNLNVFPVPDGDTGTNMYLTLSNALEEIEQVEENSVAQIADQLAKGALMGARGNSGVILSQLLKGLAEGIGDNQVLTAQNLANGLQQAANKAYQAVMKPVEGTILTVARDVGETAQELASELNIIELLIEVVNEAEKSVNSTPELLDTLKEAEVVDAGGRGYQVFLAGLLEGIKTKPGFQNDNIGQTSQASNHQLITSEPEFKYCTEFIIKNASIEVDKFRELIADYGDSLLVVNAEDILKVHIHSNHPGRVLEEGLKYGYLSKIKIDNMEEQHQEKIPQQNEQSKVTTDKLAVLSVAAGVGLEKIFKDLGADHVLQGGQSMNPSIQDLLDIIKQIKTDQLIILPNNKNVISTAEQVKDLSDKKIKVIPTTTIPQGVAAMMAFNPNQDLNQIAQEMKEELEFIKTGEITYAVRDTKIKGLEINKNDILGLIDGNIEIVNSNYNQAAVDLIEKMITEEDSLITVYVGQEINETNQEQLKKQLQKKYEGFEIEFYEGEQPIYYYIISVE